jgi:outer membrane lipopolysaccharide assembly protein LptE/RlpB
MVMKRYNANELNILAEKEMLDFIRDEIYIEFVNQILTEVNLIEV